MWRPIQQQRLDQADTAGQWRPLLDAADTEFNLAPQDRKNSGINVPLLDDQANLSAVIVAVNLE